MAIARFRPPVTTRDLRRLASAAVGWRRPDEGSFERAFSARTLDGRPLVLAPSGRVAMMWMLRALGIGPGDEVILQSWNFPAVPAAVMAAGATPRLVDVSRDSFEIDPVAVREAVTDRTRAVLCTHLYGNPVDLDGVRDVCQQRGVALLEDCAQASGATYHGRPCGTHGRAALFTFGPTKNMTLLGGGGVAVEDEELARGVRDLAADHPRFGALETTALAGKASLIALLTSRWPFGLAVFPVIRGVGRYGPDPVEWVLAEEPEALDGAASSPLPSRPMTAVGLHQLREMDDLNRRRTANGRYLEAALRGHPGLTLGPLREGGVFLSFPLLHRDRLALARAMRRTGVDTAVGFMRDCSAIPLFGRQGPCPEAARAEREILHIPVHPELSRSDLDRIVRDLQEAVHVVG